MTSNLFVKFKKLKAKRKERSINPIVGAIYKINIGRFKVGLTCPEFRTKTVIL